MPDCVSSCLHLLCHQKVISVLLILYNPSLYMLGQFNFIPPSVEKSLFLAVNPSCISESDVTNDVRCSLPDGCREAAPSGAGAGRAGKTGINGAAEGAAEGLSVNHCRRKQEADKLPPSDTSRKRETKT